MIAAQRISLKNSGGVALSFAARSGTLATPQSGTLDVWQSATFDLASFPFPEGLAFLPDVQVSGDARRSPPPEPEPIVFTMNGQTAHFEVSGTIWNWTVANGALDPPSGRPNVAGFPAQVPLYILPFSNWDQQIQAPTALTCAPQTPQDVVEVCNWAKEHGYQVRPRGVMHGWSPLTLPTTPQPNANLLLVDLTKRLNQTQLLAAGNGLPTRVRAGAGVVMRQLLEFLEAQPGGTGSAPGYSFPHTPAPGNLTLGGVLAIDAHGTAVPTPPLDAFAASYGSMSNQVVELTAVCTDPANPGAGYSLRTFHRGSDADAKAMLAHLGRTMIVEATLQVVDNYNLRCQSITNLPATTIFAAPSGANPIPPSSFADFLQRYGRVEIIWFPFSDNPWLHLWQVAPTKPAESIAVNAPYNYPFADYVPEGLQSLINRVLSGLPSLTPTVGRTAATVTANGLDGKNLAGLAGAYPVSRDIWGPSKNTLLYIQDTTLRVTANGYAVHIARTGVQQAVADFTSKFSAMLAAYEGRGQYPVNSALEIRVTALDDPSTVGVSGAETPVISALSMDATDRVNGWDVAAWFDVLTIPGTASANNFYAELEQWLLTRFSGSAGRVMPEWSKGWAYTAASGPWTDPGFLDHVRNTLTAGRDSTHDWDYEVATLKNYDAFGIFFSPFLQQLFQPLAVLK
jgi:hypothetical protein